MRRSILAVMTALVVLLGITMSAGPATAAKPAPAPAGLSTPVTGTFTDALGFTGAFAGTTTITRFSSAGGELLATGHHHRHAH
jgi:hypothetical protein